MTSWAAIYLLAFSASLLLTFLSLPWWRRWCWRHGLVDDPGPRKIHTQPTALAGGPAMMTGLLLSLLGALLLLQLHLLPAGKMANLTYGFGRRAVELAAILAGALGMLLLGGLDDRHELRPGPKFAIQMALAGLVVAAGARITLFVPSLLFSGVITILWILTVINAVNFQDNMDGLCAGLAGIGAGWFGLIAARNGDYLVACTAWLVAGAAVGFLPHNFARARAFLGDAGSHLLGYLLAVLAILPHFYSHRHPRRWAVLSPLLILAVPLADLVWVVARRVWRGQPFYVGDTSHLSHLLARRLGSQRKATLLLWATAAAAGALAWLL
jgi:UDP-GlcNAc:undecaprenyl-phosphate/decaprenyl-phosphate GlcNAc-1-phosphate transferase